MKDKNIKDELRDLNSQLPDNQVPYSIPEGYFEGLAGAVLAKIKGDQGESASDEIGQLSPLLASISRNMPYSFPDNYFQTVDEEIPVLIAEEKESAVLSFIGKTMPYVLPSGYFENVPMQVLNRVSAPRAKVVPFTRRKWMRIAVAAMAAGIIGISGIFYFTGKSRNQPGAPIAQELQNVSTRDLDDFIKNTDVTLTSSATAQNSSKADVKSLLQDVPDKELDAFLTQVSADEMSATN